MQSTISVNGGPGPHHPPPPMGSAVGANVMMSSNGAITPGATASGAGTPAAPGASATIGLSSSSNVSPGRKRKYDDPAALVSTPGLAPGINAMARDYARPPAAISSAAPQTIRSGPFPGQVPKPGYPTPHGSIVPRPLSATIPPLGGQGAPSLGSGRAPGSSFSVPMPPVVPNSHTITITTTPPAPAQSEPMQQEEGSGSQPVGQQGNFMLLTLKKMESAHVRPPRAAGLAADVDAMQVDGGEGRAKVVEPEAAAMVQDGEEARTLERPTLDERKRIMDDTIARIRADINLLRSEGPSGKLLLLLGERILEERDKAKTDAARHRNFLAYSTEQIQKHQVQEAEVHFKASLENMRDQLLDERSHQIKRLEECLRTGVALEDLTMPAHRPATRHTRARFKDGDLTLDKNAGLGPHKRRRGQALVNAVIQRTLKESEMDRDIYEIKTSDAFAIRDSDDEEEGRSSIRVRVDKGTLVYGDQVFYRNDAVIMTVARTDDQTFGTIQSINASEVLLKVTGVPSADSRPRIDITDLAEGVILLEKAPEKDNNRWDDEYIPTRSSRRG